MKIILLLFLLQLISYSAFAQTKIDEYGLVISDDEYGHLANLTEQLQQSDTSTATIVIYKGKSETIGKFLRHYYGVKTFMTRSFSISPDRFSVIFGGEDIRHTEIWLNESNTKEVKVDIKSLDEMLNGKVLKKKLFDYECIACEPAVFIDEFIFADGLKYLAQALQSDPDTRALLSISKVEFLSKTSKERRKLTNKITDILVKDHNIAKNRITIHFISGDFASFYIIPEIVKNKRK